MQLVSNSLVNALMRPEAYPDPPAEVTRIETHTAWVFLAGKRAYKVKKPVDLGFLDFTTLARRRHFCEEELRLNRRLSPAVYLGVVPIVEGRGDELRVDSQGRPVEWAVEMVRLPAARMLDAMLARGEVDNDHLNRLAHTLSRFHARAATGDEVDEHGRPESVAFNVRENFEQTLRFVGRTVSARQHEFLSARSAAFLTAQHRLLEQRVADGRVREGHGDLHAGNIAFVPSLGDGLVIYDCIEFNRRFRCLDVACDVAFLAMDLDQRGYAGFARYLLRRYEEESADGGLARVLPFYKGYRAVVRAKVESLTADGAPEAGPHVAAAKRYWQLACAYELPPALILTCGLPAVGKSWTARALARPWNAVLLASDVRRKLLAGKAPRDDAAAAVDEGLYTPESRAATYASLRASAAEQLGKGRSVVVDATFSTRARRAPFLETAAELGVAAFVVWITADEAHVAARMAARAAGRDRGASDADLEVYRAAKSAFEPPDELDRGRLVEVESEVTEPLDASSDLVDRAIAAQAD